MDKKKKDQCKKGRWFWAVNEMAGDIPGEGYKYVQDTYALINK